MSMMKRAVLVVAVLGMAMLGSCGSGTSTPQGSINSSASAFDEIFNYYVDSCIDFPCNCPGGGTIEAADNGLVLANCKASNGMIFSGTVVFNDGDSITFNFSQFGDCDDVSATITGIESGSCNGTVYGTCADEAVICSMDTTCETCSI